jgi:DNA polymerase-1
LVRFRYDDQDRQQISMTKRNGKNTPIQGTSADILKRALRLLRDELRDSNAQIVNIIHDEIVVEADANEAQDVALKVERAMCAAGEEYV